MTAEIRIPDLNEMSDYREYSAFLRRRFYRAIRNQQDVEDLTQITLEKVIKNQHRYDGRTSFAAWLTSIAGNVINDYFRRKRHEKSAFPPLTDSENNANLVWEGRTYTTPEEEAIGRETERRLHDFLTNYQHKETVETWTLDLEELSDQKISERQSISVKSVKSRLHRIRRQATEYLQIQHEFYHR